MLEVLTKRVLRQSQVGDPHTRNVRLHARGDVGVPDRGLARMTTGLHQVLVGILLRTPRRDSTHKIIPPAARRGESRLVTAAVGFTPLLDRRRDYGVA